MDRAKENYSIGKNRIVAADELEKIYADTVSSNAERFFCPQCGEYVAFVRRDRYKSYFRHCNSNATTKDCELRSKIQQSISIYERVGLPLYLKKCQSSKFELYLGFYHINEDLMRQSEKQKFTISISVLNGRKDLFSCYHINNINFSTDSTVLKKIEFTSQKYKLNYCSSDAEKLLGKRWGSEIEGISDKGALFIYSETGGKKIRVNDDVTLDTDYLYLCRGDNILNQYQGAEYEECGEIMLQSSPLSTAYYKVYKVKFNVANDVEFYKLSKFLRSHFKVSLVYKPEKLIPIWPPAIHKDNEIGFLNDHSEALLILQTEEAKSRVFIHGDCDPKESTTEALDDNKSLVKIPIEKEQVAVNINERYSSISLFLSYYRGNITTYKNNICIEDSLGNPIVIGTYTTIPVSKKIKVTSISRCKIIRINKYLMYHSYEIKDKKDITIGDIGFGDEIIAVYDIQYDVLVKYNKLIIASKWTFDDELIYSKLHKLGEPFIAPPIWAKKLLILLEQNTKTFKLVRNYIITNKMPINANKTLMKLYEIMKVGEGNGR